VPVTTTFDPDLRTLFLAIDEPWTIEEALSQFAYAKQLLDTAEKPLYSIVDLTYVRRDPNGIMRMREHPFFHHAKGEHVFMYGANGPVEMFCQMFLRLARFNRFSFLKSREECLAAIQKRLDAE
jgi:hypothetical protein